MTFKAFVASTFKDLKDHRARVIRQLRAAGFHVDPMEDWTSDSDPPKELSTARLEGCNLCVLLVAWRRGHVPAGETRSITELEHAEALVRGVDVLAYLLDEQAPWPPQYDELDSDPKIRPWRKTLTERHGVSFFGCEPESIDIAPALTRWALKRTLNSALGRQLQRLDFALWTVLVLLTVFFIIGSVLFLIRHEPIDIMPAVVLGAYAPVFAAFQIKRIDLQRLPT